MRFVVSTFMLSFSIFIRAVPFWIVLGSVIYAMFAFFAHALIVPILFLILGAGPATVLMMFAHIRSGLAVRGRVTPPDLSALFKRSFKFYRFYVIVLSIASFVMLSGFMILAKFGYLDGGYDGTIPEFGTYAGYAQAEQMITASQHWIAQLYFLATGQLMTLVYCALAVPMAANAAACTPKTRDTEVFWGLGSYTLRMYLISLLSGAALWFIMVAGIFAMAVMPVVESVSIVDLMRGSRIEGLEDMQFDMTQIAIIAGLMAAGFVWTVSLWCAGATNCFIDLSNRREIERRESLEIPQTGPDMSIDDLRALRLSRQQSFA